MHEININNSSYAPEGNLPNSFNDHNIENPSDYSNLFNEEEIKFFNNSFYNKFYQNKKNSDLQKIFRIF